MLNASKRIGPFTKISADKSPPREREEDKDKDQEAVRIRDRKVTYHLVKIFVCVERRQSMSAQAAGSRDIVQKNAREKTGAFMSTIAADQRAGGVITHEETQGDHHKLL